eukprot:scaffold229263_cov31-Tisochrysis_lutea.AAC.2
MSQESVCRTPQPGKCTASRRACACVCAGSRRLQTPYRTPRADTGALCSRQVRAARQALALHLRPTCAQ